MTHFFQGMFRVLITQRRQERRRGVDKDPLALLSVGESAVVELVVANGTSASRSGPWPCSFLSRASRN